MRLTYEAIGADMDVQPVGVDGEGRMEIPEDPGVGGWYRFGPPPGAQEGSAVIAGHSGSPRSPVGALYGLRDAQMGDLVEVTDQEGATRVFAVTSVENLGKGEADFRPWFRRTGDPTLTLITCGGDWIDHRRDYDQNIVVTAVPVED